MASTFSFIVLMSLPSSTCCVQHIVREDIVPSEGGSEVVPLGGTVSGIVQDFEMGGEPDTFRDGANARVTPFEETKYRPETSARGHPVLEVHQDGLGWGGKGILVCEAIRQEAAGREEGVRAEKGTQRALECVLGLGDVALALCRGMPICEEEVVRESNAVPRMHELDCMSHVAIKRDIREGRRGRSCS
jgi:hypothetical protein